MSGRCSASRRAPATSGARPTDGTGASVAERSLLIHGGRQSIYELAERLGHNPTVCLEPYGPVMRELAHAERISAEEQIALARRALDAGGDRVRFFGSEV